MLQALMRERNPSNSTTFMMCVEYQKNNMGNIYLPIPKKSNGVEKPSFSARAFKRKPFSFIVSHYIVFD
jgi:hypothetical protein